MESLDHRLIIFYGSSPGSGKSTLSSWLSKQLELTGFKCLWIYEDDILALSEFAAFIEAIKTTDVTMIGTLLSAAERFVARLKGDEIVITDSIFPCFNWLLATGLYTYDDLSRFSRQLLEVLQPLHPIVFFLNISPEFALKRAVSQRGDDWLEQLTQTVDGYGCNANKSISNQRDVVAFFNMLASDSLRLLEAWNTAIVDAETNSIDELKQKVLYQLQVSEVKSAETVLANPTIFTGTYRSADSELTVYQLDGRLQVNTYWPNGCELVSKTNTCFYLKDTSYYLEFQAVENGLSQVLVYHSPNEIRRYQRAK